MEFRTLSVTVDNLECSLCNLGLSVDEPATINDPHIYPSDRYMFYIKLRDHWIDVLKDTIK